MKKIMSFILAMCITAFAVNANHHMKGHGRKGDNGAMMHEKMFEMMDTDKDGKISKEEWQAHHEKHFAEMDADKDGFVNADEMKAMHEKMMKKHEKMRGESDEKRSKKKKPKKDDDE